MRVVTERLLFLDLFSDLRRDDAEVARLATATTVMRDHGEFDARFPDFYAGEVTLRVRQRETERE